MDFTSSRGELSNYLSDTDNVPPLRSNISLTHTVYFIGMMEAPHITHSARAEAGPAEAVRIH